MLLYIVMKKNHSQPFTIAGKVVQTFDYRNCKKVKILLSNPCVELTLDVSDDIHLEEEIELKTDITIKSIRTSFLTSDTNISPQNEN